MPPYNQPSSIIAPEPSLADALRLVRREIFSSLNCHHIGTIQEFDSVRQVAKATINYKQTTITPDANGVYQQTLLDYPILADCPVVFLGGGDSALTFPVVPGDECIVLFNDRDIDNWYTGASNGQPQTPRAHSFSDGLILVGIRSMGKVLTSFDTTRVCLRKGVAQVAVGGGKVKITNSTDTLNSLLQELVTEVRSLVDATSGLTVICSGGGLPSSTPVNMGTIQSIGTQLEATATKIEGLLE